MPAKLQQNMNFFIFLCLIASLTKAIRIECDFHDDYWFQIGRIYACEVNSVEIPKDSKLVSEIRGNHVEEMSNEDVKIGKCRLGGFDFFRRV